MPLHGEDDPYLTRWLQPEAVLCDVQADDVSSLFDIASREIAQAHSLDAGPVFRALSRREQAGSTALGNGFAIPHARIAGIAEPLTLFVRLAKGIDCHAPDEADVALFLFIMVPLDDEHAHLQLLAAVAQLFSNREFRVRLDATSSAEEMAQVLKSGVARIAQ